ncbi:MAG: TlpA family protein disulfide reductase [Bacteroidia bacterium]|nr:TlpA family protein disulfide reductase [Bacteroidia bacterium]
MRAFLFLGVATVFLYCSPKQPAELKGGIWRGVLDIQGQPLPFNFEVVRDAQGGYDVLMRNDDEQLLLEEVTLHGDSVTMVLHIFDSELKARVIGDSLVGTFVKNYEQDYHIAFYAVHGQNYRFQASTAYDVPDFTGEYAVTFMTESDTVPAIGMFQQDGAHVTGSFLTPTGDYRYLEGAVYHDTLRVSTFDGNHAYVFSAIRNPDSSLSGDFYSGKTYHASWVAFRDAEAAMPDASTLTYLKEGYETISFKFPDVNGNLVSLNDDKYMNKVVVLQLSGTWCPNCMDETNFLSAWYRENSDRGVEIIGLAYEAKADFAYASERVRKMVDKLHVPYDFVIAGTRDKEEASKTLPMLNRVIAFPTTIFVGKDGKVKGIHTGFSGPGTGIYFERYKEHFNQTVNELLSENLASNE